MAKPGRFGSLAFAMKNRHFGGECSRILAGKARNCGGFWVFACVQNPGKQRIWRQCPPSARKQSTKKLPNRPGFTHVHQTPYIRLPLRVSNPLLNLGDLAAWGEAKHDKFREELRDSITDTTRGTTECTAWGHAARHYEGHHDRHADTALPEMKGCGEIPT